MFEYSVFMIKLYAGDIIEFLARTQAPLRTTYTILLRQKNVKYCFCYNAMQNLRGLIVIYLGLPI